MVRSMREVVRAWHAAAVQYVAEFPVDDLTDQKKASKLEHRQKVRNQTFEQQSPEGKVQNVAQINLPTAARPWRSKRMMARMQEEKEGEVKNPPALGGRDMVQSHA